MSSQVSVVLSSPTQLLNIRAMSLGSSISYTHNMDNLEAALNLCIDKVLKKKATRLGQKKTRLSKRARRSHTRQVNETEVLDNQRNEALQNLKDVLVSGPALANAALLLAEGCPKRYLVALKELYGANGLTCPDLKNMNKIVLSPTRTSDVRVPTGLSSTGNIADIYSWSEDIHEIPASFNEVKEILDDFETFDESCIFHDSTETDVLMRDTFDENNMLNVSTETISLMQTDEECHRYDEFFMLNDGYEHNDQEEYDGYDEGLIAFNNEYYSFSNVEDWFDEDFSILTIPKDCSVDSSTGSFTVITPEPFTATSMAASTPTDEYDKELNYGSPKLRSQALPDVSMPYSPDPFATPFRTTLSPKDRYNLYGVQKTPVEPNHTTALKTFLKKRTLGENFWTPSSKLIQRQNNRRPVQTPSAKTHVCSTCSVDRYQTPHANKYPVRALLPHNLLLAGAYQTPDVGIMLSPSPNNHKIRIPKRQIVLSPLGLRC